MITGLHNISYKIPISTDTNGTLFTPVEFIYDRKTLKETLHGRAVILYRISTIKQVIMIGQRGSLLDLLPSRAQIFSRARSASGRCFMFSAQKRARERELDFSPAKNCIESRHFGANYLRLCCVNRREL